MHEIRLKIACMDDSLRALLRPELAELSSYVPAEPPGITARLDANEAPPAASEAIRETVKRAVGGVSLERYPDARARDLRAALALRTGAMADDLLVGTGSDEVISLLVNALARPRGKMPQAVILAPTPTFVMYRVTARGHGAKAVEVPLDAQWDLEATSMARAIEMMQPSIVFIASPNNPTGNRMSEARLQSVMAAAKGAFVVLDEAYVDYAAAPSLRTWRARYPHLGILRTLSKIGLAALRIGWLEADPELVREIDKTRQPFNVSATSQAAATAVLNEAWDDVRSLVSDVVRERARVMDALAKMPALTPTPTDANFIWVKTEKPAQEMYEELARRGVLVRSFHASGGRLAKQLRITIGAPRENDMLLEALAACA